MIRRAEPADAVALIGIERAAASHPWSLSQMLNSLRGERDCALVATLGEQPVGFAVYSQVLDEATLLNVAVRPDCQGRHIGSELLAATLAAMEAGGARHCLLEVRTGNVVAQGLYRRFGFTDDGTRPGYYPVAGGREDALLMSRGLGGLA